MAGKRKAKKAGKRKASAAGKPAGRPAARKRSAKKKAAKKTVRKKTVKKTSPAPRPAARKPTRETVRLLSLMELMEMHGVVELEVGADGSVRLSKAAGAPPPPPSPAPVAVPTAPAAVSESALAEEDSDLHPFPSPMVGTFYRAPSPEADMYVKEGDRVAPDSTLCTIEAMKVFNEIKAETSGTIAEILVDNGEAVEYGQPLFMIRKA